MSSSPAAGPKFPSAKNVGEVVRVLKKDGHVYREPDAESTGVVTSIIPFGFSMGVIPLPRASQFF